MSDKRFSISRAIQNVVTRGIPTGVELEESLRIQREFEAIPAMAGLRGGRGTTVSVPFNAFVGRRDVSVSGDGSNLFGRPVQEALGLLRWSAVARSGATILDNLSANTGFVHCSRLPPVTWLPESGAIIAADPLFRSSTAQPYRVCAQVRLTRQLVIQSSPRADEFVSREIGRSLSAALDNAALYGRSINPNEPRGVLTTPGTNNLPLGNEEFFTHLALMRRVALETDGEPDSYGLITSPWLESEMVRLPAYANGSISTWASIDYNKEVSNQVLDHRIFTGLWAYLIIATFGPGVDLIVDPFTESRTGTVIITANIFADTVVRFPEAFSYTESLPPPPPRQIRKEELSPEIKVSVVLPKAPTPPAATSTPEPSKPLPEIHPEPPPPPKAAAESEERGNKKNFKSPFR